MEKPKSIKVQATHRRQCSTMLGNGRCEIDPEILGEVRVLSIGLVVGEYVFSDESIPRILALKKIPANFLCQDRGGGNPRDDVRTRWDIPVWLIDS